MKKIARPLQVLSYKQMVIYLFVSFGFLAILFFCFISCAPPEGAGRLGSGDGDEVDEVEDCTGDDQCQKVCEKIYDESWRECNSKGAETVSNLHRVFNRLRSSSVRRSKLDDLSSDDDSGININHFRTYLEVGADGWLRQIEGYSTDEGNDFKPYSKDSAQKVIEWLAEEENAAEVLSDVSRGSEILEALLKAAITSASTGLPRLCFWINGAYKVIVESETVFNPDEYPKIKIEDSSDSEVFNIRIDGSRYKDLYNLLSCREVSEPNGHDIFSLAADESNPHLFDVAFNLLDEVCAGSVLKSSKSQKEAICRRIMMCVLAIHYNGEKEIGGEIASITEDSDDVSNWDGWAYAEERFSDSSGGFDTDQACDLSSTEFGGNIEID